MAGAGVAERAFGGRAVPTERRTSDELHETVRKKEVLIEFFGKKSVEKNLGAASWEAQSRAVRDAYDELVSSARTEMGGKLGEPYAKAPENELLRDYKSFQAAQALVGKDAPETLLEAAMAAVDAHARNAEGKFSEENFKKVQAAVHGIAGAAQLSRALIAVTSTSPEAYSTARRISEEHRDSLAAMLEQRPIPEGRIKEVLQKAKPGQEAAAISAMGLYGADPVGKALELGFTDVLKGAGAVSEQGADAARIAKEMGYETAAAQFAKALNAFSLIEGGELKKEEYNLSVGLVLDKVPKDDYTLFCVLNTLSEFKDISRAVELSGGLGRTTSLKQVNGAAHETMIEMMGSSAEAWLKYSDKDAALTGQKLLAALRLEYGNEKANALKTLLAHEGLLAANRAIGPFELARAGEALNLAQAQAERQCPEARYAYAPVPIAPNVLEIIAYPREGVLEGGKLPNVLFLARCQVEGDALIVTLVQPTRSEREIGQGWDSSALKKAEELATKLNLKEVRVIDSASAKEIFGLSDENAARFYEKLPEREGYVKEKREAVKVFGPNPNIRAQEESFWVKELEGV